MKRPMIVLFAVTAVALTMSTALPALADVSCYDGAGYSRNDYQMQSSCPSSHREVAPFSCEHPPGAVLDAYARSTAECDWLKANYFSCYDGSGLSRNDYDVLTSCPSIRREVAPFICRASDGTILDRWARSTAECNWVKSQHTNQHAPRF